MTHPKPLPSWIETLKRYDVMTACGKYHPYGLMMPEPDGDYVKLDDLRAAWALEQQRGIK